MTSLHFLDTPHLWEESAHLHLLTPPPKITVVQKVPLAMKKRESSPSFQTPMQSKLKSFSAVYATRPIQLSLGWPNISSCTVMPSLGNHSAASTVTRSMSVWERLRCTSGPTHYLVSARSVARLSLDPGYFKDTLELTLVRTTITVADSCGYNIRMPFCYFSLQVGKKSSVSWLTLKCIRRISNIIKRLNSSSREVGGRGV